MFSSLIEVVRMLSLFRTVWLAGRYGGGKTSLGVWLALQMVEQKYASGICSNVPLNVGVNARLVEIDEAKTIQDCVLLIDEAWLEMKQGTDQKKLNTWLAYLRKGNQYLILPSVRPLAKDLRDFVVERTWNFSEAGIPLWWYQWTLTTGGLTKKKNTPGQFYIWKPQRIFKYYDHSYRPSDTFYYYSVIPTATGTGPGPADQLPKNQ